MSERNQISIQFYYKFYVDFAVNIYKHTQEAFWNTIFSCMNALLTSRFLRFSYQELYHVSISLNGRSRRCRYIFLWFINFFYPLREYSLNSHGSNEWSSKGLTVTDWFIISTLICVPRTKTINWNLFSNNNSAFIQRYSFDLEKFPSIGKY